MSLSTNRMDKVTALREARRNKQPIVAFSGNEAEFTLEEGYAVQRALLEMALADGEELAGFKMGLTSRAKQRDVGVDSAIHGFILKSQEEEKGGTVNLGHRIHPRVEPEVAAVLGKPLGETPPTLREVRLAVSGLFPALEILDSRYQGFSFRLPDVVADNTSASGFMLGHQDLTGYGGELPWLGVSMKKNGELIDTGCPAAVFGDPLLSVLALAKEFYKAGRVLSPGSVILTGGLTAAMPITPGDFVEVIWPNESLSFRCI